MNKNTLYIRLTSAIILLLIVAAPFCQAKPKYKSKPGWKKELVNINAGGDRKIKAIHYPSDKPVKTRKKQEKSHPVKRKAVTGKEAQAIISALPQEMPEVNLLANIIESPPVDGFVPYIAVSITTERKSEFEIEAPTSAVTSTQMTGPYPATIDPTDDYAIGLFDTGASTHVIGNATATTMGMFIGGVDNDLVTTDDVLISGVNSSVIAKRSEPLGLYIDGLGAIDDQTLELDISGMTGEWNVSVTVGQTPGAGEPDLPTAIGMPLSVFFDTWIRNDQQVTITRDSTEYTAPDILVYEPDHPALPDHANRIPLELKPLGSIDVQYVPPTDLIFDIIPGAPSIILGTSSQSLFFVHSVSLSDRGNEATNEDRFMLDTGAQVTVIGSRIATLLKIDEDWPDFLVEIIGVTGIPNMIPGFYVDSLVIPAVPESIIAHNVPVVLLDISSPEGGTLDGIIGMNLFNDFNMVLRGGGLGFDDDPALEFEAYNRIVADIAPEGGDGTVDALDLEAMSQAWLGKGSMPPSPNWNPIADIASAGEPNAIINFLDFSVLAQHWLETASE